MPKKTSDPKTAKRVRQIVVIKTDGRVMRIEPNGEKVLTTGRFVKAKVLEPINSREPAAVRFSYGL